MAAREFARLAPEARRSCTRSCRGRVRCGKPAAWYAVRRRCALPRTCCCTSGRSAGGIRISIWRSRSGRGTGGDGEAEKRDPRRTRQLIMRRRTLSCRCGISRASTRRPGCVASRHRSAGLQYLFKAQYPERWVAAVLPAAHWVLFSHITYNDDAMVGVMERCATSAAAKPDYAFVGGGDRARAGRRSRRAIECILKTQVVEDGKLTVWCAQHDERRWRRRRRALMNCRR